MGGKPSPLIIKVFTVMRMHDSNPDIHVKYYFTYCEAGFVTKTLGDVIITVGREGALELMEGIPI